MGGMLLRDRFDHFLSPGFISDQHSSVHSGWTYTSPSATMHTVCQIPRPMRGVTPRYRPRIPLCAYMYRNVLPILSFAGRLGSAFWLCISTRITSMGWFQLARAPPTPEASIFSTTPSRSSRPLLVALRIASSTSREKPNRDPQLVTCRIATALTPLLIPRNPSVRNIVTNVSRAPGGFSPAAACFCRVISAVFIQVQNPTVAYAWAAPPTMPPAMPDRNSEAPTVRE